MIAHSPPARPPSSPFLSRLAIGAMALALLHGPAPAARVLAAPDEVCQVHVDKVARPTHLELGGLVQIELSITPDCPAGPGGGGMADIVLVIDRSSSQADNGTWQPTLDAATVFLDLVDYQAGRVGIVAFEAGADLSQELTDDPARLKAALAGIEEPPALGLATNITAGIQAAQRELAGSRHRAEAQPILILLSDGEHNALFTASPSSAATAAKDAGTIIITIGLTTKSRGTNLMRAMATKPEYYFPAPTAADLEGAYREAAGLLTGGPGRITELAITDILTPEVRYVDGSAEPPATVSGGNTLRWTAPALAAGERWSARYLVEPLVVGRYLTNKLAYVDYLDADGQAGNRYFPEPIIEVRAKGDKIRVYLPLLQKDYCKPGDPFDVVLALDTSSSMDPPKFEAMRAAAREFLSFLDLPPTQAALVAFHGQAVRVSGLSTDRAALLAALDSLPRGEGTRIDRALEASTAVMTGAGRGPGHKGVIVLITDGRQEETGEQPVLNAASGARRNAELYVIGLGTDVDPQFLTRVAGDPDRFFRAPDSAELVRIYSRIAGALPCGR